MGREEMEEWVEKAKATYDIFNSGLNCLYCGWQGEGYNDKTDPLSQAVAALPRDLRSVDITRIMFDVIKDELCHRPGYGLRKNEGGQFGQLIIEPTRDPVYGGIILRCPNCYTGLMIISYRSIEIEVTPEVRLIP